MDILHKLRIVFWLLVSGLWGVFMYQYIAEDLSPEKTIYLEKNPFSWSAPPERIKKIEIPEFSKSSRLYASRTSTKPISHLTPILGAGEIKDIPAEISSGKFVPEHTGRERESISKEKYEKYPPAPKGFEMRQTRHFVIYEEGGVRKETVAKIENLHGNIMIDLIAFSPWTREKKVFIFLCKSQKTYQNLTGRPAWSGGTASLSQRKIFLYKSYEAYSILAHELTHIYFDSFFLPTIDPLWLSEGMAVYIQAQRGYSAPLWLKSNMVKLTGGAGYKLKDLMRIETLEGADPDSVRLWYAQCYSIVKFLMKMKPGDAFYQFCKYIKEGKPIHTALYRAYGMPFNRIEALEYAWRYDLKTKKISGLH